MTVIDTPYYGPCNAGTASFGWLNCTDDATEYVEVVTDGPEWSATNLMRLCSDHADVAESVPGFVSRTKLAPPALEYDRPDHDDEDDDEVGPPVSTVEDIRAEHVAQIRVANADRGVDEIARLVRLGTLPQESLEAAKTELEAARNALGLVHATPIGEVPSSETYAAMAVDPKTMPYLRKPSRNGCGAVDTPQPLPSGPS